MLCFLLSMLSPLVRGADCCEGGLFGRSTVVVAASVAVAVGAPVAVVALLSRCTCCVASALVPFLLGLMRVRVPRSLLFRAAPLCLPLLLLLLLLQ